MSSNSAVTLSPALYYQTLANQQLRCTLCPHDCRIASDHRGACGVRVNRGSRLFTLVGNRIVSTEVDPIEKKPLFHFLPGSSAYSIATVGCNFRCRFCQNWTISQWPKLREQEGRGGPVPSALSEHPLTESCLEKEPSEEHRGLGTEVVPSKLVQQAMRMGCRSIACTYTEPMIFYELALDTARMASAAGVGNVFVTNGFISLEPLREVAPYLSAANIDLKSLRDSYYEKLCGARLEPVLTAIREYKKLGVWIELTTLLITGLNDDERELRDIARFIKTDLDEDVPWHISRFFPAYKMEHWQETPISSLLRARDVGREEGLRYVYIGNAPEMAGGEDTRCHRCNEVLIRRWGVRVIENALRTGHCPKCAQYVSRRWTLAS